MAHYAYLDSDSIVTQVIVGKDEDEGGTDWEQYYGAVRTSYNTHGGEFDSFLYLDRVDSDATAAPFGVGDGTATVFQALRPWGGFAEPVDAFVGTPVVHINGTPTTGFSVTAGSGVITFASAPASGAVLTWTGQHYRRCRFAMGELTATQFLHTLWETRRVQLISTKA